MDNQNLEILAGNSNPPLAQEISKALGKELIDSEVSQFSDGEISVHIKETVRGKDLFVIQSTSPPVNDNLMELLIIIDALKRASAKRITAVIPYYGYARQDRKHKGRVPISAKLVANLIQVAGADRMLTLDLHAGQIQGFFDIPVDNLWSNPILAGYFESEFKGSESLVVVSPDVGGVKRARLVAERLNVSLAIVEKRRMDFKERTEALNVIGEVEGKTVLIVDDMISTGGTLVEASKILKDRGVKEQYASCTHGIFSNGAVTKLKDSPFKKVVVTDTIRSVTNDPFIEYISVAHIFAKSIDRIHNAQSVSALFPHY